MKHAKKNFDAPISKLSKNHADDPYFVNKLKQANDNLKKFPVPDWIWNGEPQPKR